MKNKEFIPVSKPVFIGNEKIYVNNCLDSTWISSNGEYIERLERKFAEYIGIKHAIACSNGTAALHLALLAIGIGRGDEVIVPALTFVATANAVEYTGAKPVFADCQDDTWNIDPHKVEKLITSRTKAIVVVPLYGHPCEMDSLVKLSRKNNIYLIEDAAEAIGAIYRGRKCGSIADLSTFSFYGNKTITTGEGGMVVTNNDGLHKKVRLFKTQGMDPNRRYWFTTVGYNYRMTNIQAAIGLAQMENVDKFIEKRRQIAESYRANLFGIPGLTLPVERDDCTHSYWMYSVLFENEFGADRDAAIKTLYDHGVETRPFFYPMHIMPVHKQNSHADLKLSEKISSKGINLPTFFELKEKQIKYISQIIRELNSK